MSSPGSASSSGSIVPSVTATTATAIAVADMVGTGVFTSLGFQVPGIPSGFSLLMLWVVGGIVALCGALSYAELSAAFPRSGGEYNFLSRVYSPAVGFLAGWVSATFGFAAPVAIAAIAFGDYFQGLVPGVPKLYLGLALIWITSAILITGMKQSSVFQDVMTGLKILLIVVLIVAGFAVGGNTSISFVPTSQDLSHIASTPFAISLVYVMYAYSGWNAATYISGEIKDPQRNVPRSLIIATLIVTGLYVALNAAFLYTTPVQKLAGQVNVGLIAGTEIFGPSGGKIVGGLICLGLVSAVSAMMWIGPRVTMVMGEDVPLLRWFAHKTQAGVPARALVVQTLIATVLLFTGTFEKVVLFIQFSFTLCSFLAVLGVIVLRFTRPDLPRPYTTWGYPITPIIFLCITLWMLAFQIMDKPFESLSGLAMMFTGLLVYWYGMSRDRTLSAT